MATDPTTPPATGDDAGDAGTPPNPDLGDGGKKALEAERKARRDAERAARDLQAKLKEFEDRDKSDTEKAADRATAAEKRADEAEARALRIEVAMAKGLTAAQAKRLVGSTKDELEADADEIIEAFPVKPPTTDPAGDAGGDGGGERRPPSARPTPDLRGGGDPTQPVDDMDPKKLASFIPRP